jgi:hypothetical protein
VSTILYTWFMSSPAKASRETKVLAVIKLANEDLSISAACRKVGISRSSFYDFCNRSPEAIRILQDLMTQASRVELLEVLLTRTRLVDKLIKIALSDDIKPMELVAIFKETDRYLDKLLRFMRIEGGDNPEAAAEVLAGPVLVQGQSRFTAEFTSPEEKTGSVDRII